MNSGSDGRVCTICKDFKPWDQFYKQSNGKNGRKARCIPCLNEKKAPVTLAWYSRNRTKEMARMRRSYQEKLAYHKSYHRQRTYNLSDAQYAEMIEKQGGCCLICKRKFTGRIAIDHNHQTGKVRGLLCTTCNSGLGKLKDSIGILQSAIDYLRQYDG